MRAIWVKIRALWPPDFSFLRSIASSCMSCIFEFDSLNQNRCFCQYDSSSECLSDQNIIHLLP